MIPEGTVVGGKYRVEHVLGEGGMGVVVAARHLDLGTRVALKFLNPDMAKHPSIVERFMREARASAQLQSENVCRVMDVGRVEETGIPFIVMELLTGQDLSRILKTQGPLAAATVAEYVLQASQAIAEAHALGIVHRDLKPGNLFVTQRPNGKPLIKVLDFGVAKVSTPDQDFSLTRTHNVMGSPGYMSPEQLKSSKVVDARADIWSLGVVMYELICGRQPFTAESITELAVRVVTEAHPPLPQTLPRGFVDIVGRCLEKDPARRYPDVAALAAALAPFAAGGQETAIGISRVLRGNTQGDMVPLAAPAGPNTPTTLGSASGVSEHQPTRRRGVLAGVIGASAAAGVIAVILVTGGKSKDDDRARGATVPAPPPATAPIEAVPTPTETRPAEPTPTKPAADTAQVQTPPEPKPVETKPVETKPVETKPVEAKPVETKPVEAKTTTTKPVETKPTETKPTETKPTETKPTEKKKPGTKKGPTVEDLSDMRK